MKVVVIGGTGLIGSKLVHLLTEHGHDAIATSPNTGVNTMTGEPRSLPGGDAELARREAGSQEELVADSQIPYSIVQATQFFEFVERYRRRGHPRRHRAGRTGVHPADGRDRCR